MWCGSIVFNILNFVDVVKAWYYYLSADSLVSNVRSQSTTFLVHLHNWAVKTLLSLRHTMCVCEKQVEKNIKRMWSVNFLVFLFYRTKMWTRIYTKCLETSHITDFNSLNLIPKQIPELFRKSVSLNSQIFTFFSHKFTHHVIDTKTYHTIDKLL